MTPRETVVLQRDCDAALIPAGTRVTLLKGESATITQSLGGSYTVMVNGNLFRIDGKDADALGLTVAPVAASAAAGAPTAAAPATPEQLEKTVWDALRSCFDPEIPVNIVDLGLVYDCQLKARPGAGCVADVKMTLTAPGCGMGPVLVQDVQNKLLCIEGIDEANVELVWDPPWNQGMLTEAARLQLGLM